MTHLEELERISTNRIVNFKIEDVPKNIVCRMPKIIVFVHIRRWHSRSPLERLRWPDTLSVISVACEIAPVSEEDSSDKLALRMSVTDHPS